MRLRGVHKIIWGIALVSMTLIVACTGPSSTPPPAPSPPAPSSPVAVESEPAPEVFAAPEPAAGDPPVGDRTNQWLTDVATIGSTVVAVGGDHSDNVLRPLLWVSADGGKRFTAAELDVDQERQSVPRASALGVAAGKAGFVAYGFDGKTLLWHSPDGKSWSELDRDETIFPEGVMIGQLIATDTGFLALAIEDRGRTGSDERLVVWQSGDGRAWQRLDRAGKSLGHYSGSASLSAVVAHGRVIVIAANLDDSGDDAQPDRIAIWRSGDGGETWSRVRTDPALGGGYRAYPVSLRFQDGRFLLLAKGEGADGDSWDATLLDGGPDGTRWRDRAKPVAWGTDVDESPAEVIKIGHDYLIAGNETPDRSVISLGPSLSHQQRLRHRSLGPDTEISAASAAGRGAIVVGHNGRSGSTEPAIWLVTEGKISMPDIPATGGRPPVDVHQLVSSKAGWQALGTAGGAPTTWTSQDGLDWTATRLPGRRKLGEQAAVEAVATDQEGRTLAVGGKLRSPRGAEVILWRHDPQGWVVVPSKAFVSDVPDDYGYLRPGAIAGGPRGWIIAGAEEADGRSDLIIWFSRDGRTWAEARGTARVESSDRDRSSRRTTWKEFRAPGDGWISINGAAATADGFLVAGVISEDGVHRPVTWASTDGRTWSGPDPLPLADGSPSATPELVLVANGRMIIKGRTGAHSGDDDSQQIVWSRPVSGGAWAHRVITDPAVARFWFNDVIAIPGGFLALGGNRDDDQSDARAWTSPDGLAWTPLPLDLTRGSGPGDQVLYTAAVDGDRLLVLATDVRHVGGGDYTVRIPLPRP